MACDYAINPMLLDAGLTLPKGVLCEARFRGMSGGKSITGSKRKRARRPRIAVMLETRVETRRAGNQRPEARIAALRRSRRRPAILVRYSMLRQMMKTALPLRSRRAIGR
jgi:hypothetical protein